MRGKKAKLIRKLLKEKNAFKWEPEYHIKRHRKIVYERGEFGKAVAREVERPQLINKSRTTYRRVKRAYKNGVLNNE
jgi:hypothetical protein